MSFCNRQRAFTLVELMVTVSIIAILAVITYQSSAGVLRQQNTVNQMTIVKNAITQARARALEQTAVAKVDFAGGRVLTLLDLNGNGAFGDAADELITGESTTQGIELQTKFAEMIPGTHSDLGGAIPHPSGVYNVNDNSQGSFSTFVDDEFYILPTGLVYDEPGTNNPSGGTVFMRSSDGALLAMVHVTGLGDVRTAIRNKNDTDWTWQ